MAADSWVATGQFWVTLAVGLATIMATVINYLLFRTQVDPNVVVYVVADERRPTLIILVIENIGKGVAKNIRFQLSEPLPAKAFGFDNPPNAKVMDSGPLITGIPALGPGAKRVLTWGQFGGLHKAIGERTISVTALYDADSHAPWEAEHFNTVSLLDVKSLETTDVSDHNYDKVAADQLKAMATSLEQLARGWRTIKVELATPPRNDPNESDE